MMGSSYFVRFSALRLAIGGSRRIQLSFSTAINSGNNAYNTRRLHLHQWKYSKSFSTSFASRQTEKLVNVDHDKIRDNGTVKTITMMSPKTRNSLSLDMIEQLIENIDDNSSEGRCRCIVIKGEGKAFSAGHNLKEMTMDEGRDYHVKIFERCNALMDKIISCPLPVIAVVDGVAAAAGCQLVAMCDIAIATEASRYI